MKNQQHTPWSDSIDLLTLPDNQDAEGYGTAEPLRRRLMCTFSDGVSQREFYLAQKAGLEASASVELWHADYEGERFAEFGGVRYKVVRSYRASFDTITLILSEVTA